MQHFVFVNSEEVNVKLVEVLDIEEDFQGRDLVTFNYRGEERQSYVIQRWGEDADSLL